MRRIYYFCALSCFLLLSSCSNCLPREEVICSTIHRYGVSLDPSEWSERGQNGQIISVRTDGVTVTRAYEGGILHGDCTYSQPYREAIERKQVYNQGVLREEFSYFPTGVPCDHIVYENPNVQSKISWYENGAPQSKERIQNNILCEGEYYNLEQQVESQIHNGCGIKTCRNSNGILEYCDQIEQGQTTIRTHYHPNGHPAAVATYSSGMINGERRTYLVGGEPATIEAWENNKQHGNTITFEFGYKRAEVPYLNGTIEGVERVYRDDQTLAQEIAWHKGMKHGPCHTYVGSTSQTDWFFQGKKVANKATYELMCNL